MIKAEYEKLAAFRYELRKFLHFSEQAAKQQGLASRQYLALLAIEGYPERDSITIGELAERLQVTAHSAVELADRLEIAGLAKRKVSEEDRRQVFIQLTKKGRTKLEKLAQLHRDELKIAGPLLIKVLSGVLES